MFGAPLALAIALALNCHQPNINEELRPTYCAALLSWFPYIPTVKSVQWCTTDYDCGAAQVGQGGGYEASSNSITIDRSWPFRGNGLLLTLEHEVGHALGLKHTPEGIMKQGWDAPVAQGPSEADFAVLVAAH